MPLSALAAAGIAAAASAAAGGIHAAAGAQASSLSYKRQRELLAYQTELNRENWRMQNAYNTDVAQVGRRRAAGLNAVTIDGASNAGTISGATPGSVNMQPIPDFQSIVGQALGAAQMRSTMNLQDSAAELNYAQAANLRGDTPTSQATMALQQSTARLNDVTRQLTSVRSLSEYQKYQISTVDYEIRKIDKVFRELDYQKFTTSIQIDLGHGRSTNMPYFLADTLFKGAEVASSLARSRKDIMEADNWIESFRASMDSIASTIRKNTASSVAQEFENMLNRRLESLIEKSRAHGLYYEAEKAGNMYWREKRGSADLGRIIQSLSPFSSAVK